ncbi:hypothetical protein [Acidovorax sp. RAC01]|uniref:hypothetical protein n=1 Tax=Acidovorax sp. RAC01 TaxID=1842533 RepID=UPI0008564949|nr:hypothetical protein [Acidovorax sp. RAC01]AOG22308.1 hypothetical protein BSY15_3733 [Acidovorax sp. RAC01]AOG23810.1 hypothetical protein BSY15_3811 [Acidovorax sp. RAC01]
MPNGRALPTALLFDSLLGRAWNMAMVSYANAERFTSRGLAGQAGPESGVGVGGGAPGIETFLSRYAGDEAAAMVAAHDLSVRGQLQEVAERWAVEFQGVIQSAAPVGPGYRTALEWLRTVVGGRDGLGYVGYDRRMAQASNYAEMVTQWANPRGLATPPGASQAQRQVAAQMAGLHVSRAGVQMTADREAERHKLQVDAVETLLRAYNAALDAAMEHTFTQMHLMFDVFGRNNDYLTRLQRHEQAVRARMDVRSAELSTWDERVATRDDSQQASTQQLKALVERANTKASMSAEAHIKLLRRYSSRAAAALNSAGVSVNSTASESNNINAGG